MLFFYVDIDTSLGVCSHNVYYVSRERGEG